MSDLTNFKAVYCSGLFIPEPATVSALSLLFEKIRLPNNAELISEFSKKYRFVGDFSTVEEFFEKTFLKGREAQLNVNRVVGIKNEDGTDLFTTLSKSQRQTAYIYFFRGIQFGSAYKSLFGEVFESSPFNGVFAIDVASKDTSEAKRRTVTVTLSTEVDLQGSDAEFSQLLSVGYIPVVDHKWGRRWRV